MENDWYLIPAKTRKYTNNGVVSIEEIPERVVVICCNVDIVCDSDDDLQVCQVCGKGYNNEGGRVEHGYNEDN